MVEINPAKLEEEIKAFKKGIKRQNELNHVVEAIPTAVDLAYNDAKRTMSRIKEEDRDKALKDIETALYKFLTSELAPEFDERAFDEEHKKLCEEWWKKFEGSVLGTYGKAQKIINMAFKYLYCCDDAREGEKYHDHFKYCHMPLDSFTLTWFRRDVKRKIIVDNEKKTINDEYKWSKIKEKEYDTIHEEIKAYINKAKYTLSPLELEFIVWPEIQKHLSAEDLLFGLVNDLYFHGYLSEEDYSSKEKMKKRIIEMPLDEKYGRITKLLSEMQLIEKGYIPNAYFD